MDSVSHFELFPLIYSLSAILWARLASWWNQGLALSLCRGFQKEPTAAARSNCPGAPPLGLTPPGRSAFGTAGGLDAVGTGGFPGIFGAVGLVATGGGGAGFFPTGGAGGAGFAPAELDGREFAGVVPVDAAGVLFHGGAAPLEDAMPGNTDTGFAEALAVRD
jgi:hypothetical protein